MATPDAYVGDIGFQVFIATGVDVSSATARAIRFTKPDGTTGEWVAQAATKDGADGVEFVTTSASDLDQAGTWRLEVELVGYSGFTGTSGPASPPLTMLVGRPQPGTP